MRKGSENTNFVFLGASLFQEHNGKFEPGFNAV